MKKVKHAIYLSLFLGGTLLQVAAGPPDVSRVAQPPNAVAITGGSIKNVTVDNANVGVNTPAIGDFTNLSATGTVSGTGFSTLLSPYLTTTGATALYQPLLGFTPYNASNPNNYIAASGAPVQTVAGRTGTITLTHSDLTDWASATSGFLTTPYTLPTASSTTLGGVKPDGVSLTNTAGSISVTYGTSANTAAQGNDSRITGALSVSLAASTYQPLLGFTPISLSSLSAGTGISYNTATGQISNTAPNQTVSITAGTGLSVTGAYPSFTITNSGLTVNTGNWAGTWQGNAPSAFQTTLGFTPYNATNPSGYQTAAQVTSAIAGAAYTLPTASSTTLGGVKPDGVTLTNTAGSISVSGTAIPAGTVGTPLCEIGTAGQSGSCGSSTVLPNGTTATTAIGDSSAKVATTGAVIADIGNYSGINATPVCSGCYKLPIGGGIGGSITPTSGYLYLALVDWPPGSVTIKNITMRFSGTAPTSAYSIEGCLYTYQPSNPSAPGALVSGGDTTAGTSGTTAYATVTMNFPTAITPASAKYWMGLLVGGSTGSIYSIANSVPQIPVANMAGSFTFAYTMVQTGITVGSTGSSNCPGTFSGAASGTLAAAPLLGLGG